MEECDFLILGAGLAGLSAAVELGDGAIVLEQHERPGGLVRTENFNGYWFDHVIHLLHFSDAATKSRVMPLFDGVLAPCPPAAWVECAAGTVRYPFQLHLGGLTAPASSACLRDFAEAAFDRRPPAADYESMLLQTFGRAMCETFFFPYNRKVWKRPLNTLAPSGFQWNIARPTFEEVLQGILRPEAEGSAYNSDAWYPRPPRGSPVRGMEVLARALARQVKDLRLGHRVEAVDLESRTVSARRGHEVVKFRFREGCVCTLPLPLFMSMCQSLPERLRRECAGLRRNRVLTATVCISGPRPEGRGHWRYYADESLVFNRLVYPHEFDPECAPEDGWTLMAEITEPAETRPPPPQKLLDRVLADIVRAGALPADCRVIDRRLLLIDPAYVVFLRESGPVVEQALSYLRGYRVFPLGRYGRWEYSSMAHVMRDGFACKELLAGYALSV
jgi:protoporphyrinogen oxidase